MLISYRGRFYKRGICQLGLSIKTIVWNGIKITKTYYYNHKIIKKKYGRDSSGMGNKVIGEIMVMGRYFA